MSKLSLSFGSADHGTDFKELNVSLNAGSHLGDILLSICNYFLSSRVLTTTLPINSLIIFLRCSMVDILGYEATMALYYICNMYFAIVGRYANSFTRFSKNDLRIEIISLHFLLICKSLIFCLFKYSKFKFKNCGSCILTLVSVNI